MASTDEKNRRVIVDAETNRLPVHKFTLSFKSKHLQQVFDEYSTEASVDFVRMALGLAVFLYIAFSWLDPYVMSGDLWDIRLARLLGCLLFLTVIGLTYTAPARKQFQLLISMVVILGGVDITAMILISEPYGAYHYYAGLLLAVMYAHALLRLRFVYATLSTWGIILLYIMAIMTFGSTPGDIFMSNLFFLFSANIMGMFASYWLEYYMKSVFWKTEKLQEKSGELAMEYDRKSHELEMARRMQLNMLPQKSPYHPDYKFSFSMKAATEVGGDFYDFCIDEDRVLTFAIGDATGHGAQASVMVTAVKLIFSEHAHELESVEFLQKASGILNRMGFGMIFMALAVGKLKGDHLEISGAGMPPALVYRASTGKLEKISLKGLPLGGGIAYPYQKQRVQLQEGDTTLLMTDGFAELFNNDGKMFGYQKVEQSFLEIASTQVAPDTILEHLHRDAEHWLDGAPQPDDLTFFVIQRKVHIKKKNKDEQTTLEVRQALQLTEPKKG